MVQNRSARNTQDRKPTGQKEESWRRILGTTPDAVGRIHTSIWRLLIFKWWCQRLFKDFRKKCQSYWQKHPQRACFSWIFALREHRLYFNLSTVRLVEVKNWSRMSFKISHAVVICMLFPAICAANRQDVEVSFTLTTRWQVRFTFKHRAFITPRRSRLNP